MAKDDEKLDKLDRIIGLLEEIASGAAGAPASGGVGAAGKGASGRAAAESFSGFASSLNPFSTLTGAAGFALGGAGALFGAAGSALNSAERFGRVSGLSAAARTRQLGGSELAASGAQIGQIARQTSSLPFGDVLFARTQQKLSAEDTAIARTQATLEGLARVGGSVSDDNIRRTLRQQFDISERETSLSQRVQNIANEEFGLGRSASLAEEASEASIALQGFTAKLKIAADLLTGVGRPANALR